MNLGFYYHINVFVDGNGRIHLPAYLGMFVDELAKNVDKLYYFAYTVKCKTEQDYMLIGSNVELVNLGSKKRYPITLLMGYSILNNHKDKAKLCDAILVRSPSALAPFFYMQFNKVTKIVYLMVGDYIDGIKNQNFGFVKQSIINVFTHYNEWLQNRVVRTCLTMVNSRKLFNKYNGKAKEVYEVRTTTLNEDSFCKKEDSCGGECVNLMFVGTLNREKGVLELLSVAIRLIKEGRKVKVNFVGKEYFKDKPIEAEVTMIAKEQEVEDSVIFHGYRTAGKELMEMYKLGDIYVLPSYHEGFPRTIWEAMASSLPVVSTTVGSIPLFLRDGEDALLVEPKNVDALYEVVVKVIDDDELRRKLIKNGFALAKTNTQEIQTKKIIDKIQTVLCGEI